MLEPGIIALIVATSGATIALIVKFALLSKCDSVNICWGCCSIHRNTSQELQQPPASPLRSEVYAGSFTPACPERV
jgi:hypothetical protein